MPALNHLTFELEEIADGIVSLVAMASTPEVQHGAVMADVRRALDWAWRHFPSTHGPADNGMDCDHDLHMTIEAGGRHTVTLTLTGNDRFVTEFMAAFGRAAV